MLKRILVLVIAVIMMLGVCGLAGCNNMSLADHKVTGKAKIDDLVATKVQSD